MTPERRTVNTGEGLRWYRQGRDCVTTARNAPQPKHGWSPRSMLRDQAPAFRGATQADFARDCSRRAGTKRSASAKPPNSNAEYSASPAKVFQKNGKPAA